MSTERGYFLNGPGYSYGEQDFATVFSQVFGGNGVSNTNGELGDLAVTAKQNMDVLLATGFAVANGFMYENAEAATLTHDIAEPTQDRIDRVVIQFNTDPNVREFGAYIKKGAPAASPTPPAVTRNTYIHELSVAQVRIRAGKSFIEQVDITDERNNAAVCGYIPLHNLLRGIQVDANGTVNMPNQSYVEVSDGTDILVPDNVDTVLPLSNFQRDNQSEIRTATQEFIPKSAGVYLVFAYVAYTEGEMTLHSDANLAIGVNGEYATIIDSKVFLNDRDNILNGSTMVSLAAGDRLTVTAKVANYNGTSIYTRNHRVRIAKMF